MIIHLAHYFTRSNIKVHLRNCVLWNETNNIGVASPYSTNWAKWVAHAIGKFWRKVYFYLKPYVTNQYVKIYEIKCLKYKCIGLKWYCAQLLPNVYYCWCILTIKVHVPASRMRQTNRLINRVILCLQKMSLLCRNFWCCCNEMMLYIPVIWEKNRVLKSLTQVTLIQKNVLFIKSHFKCSYFQLLLILCIN